ncbi:FAD:protein FMN transferase [Halomonas sp. WWR20]
MIGRSIRQLSGLAHLGLALLLCMLLAGCQKQPQAYRFEGPVFGTGFHVTLYGSYDQERIDALEASILAALNEVDGLMSTYKRDSELSRFNRSAVNVPFKLSPPTADVINESIAIGEMSGGAFDVTVGAAVNLWGFGPDMRPETIPSDEEVAQALATVNFRALQLEGNTLTKTQPVYVDLSGIAKGYGVDRVAQRLDAEGVTSYLVEIGGEIRTRGEKPGGEAWRIAVEKPVSNERAVQRIVELSDAAVATSGDYRNYYERDGQRFSHTVDPRTGRPVTHRLASVTIIAERCSTADALATAITVLGPEAGMKLAERENIAAYFIVKTDEGFETRVSRAFRPYLQDASEGGAT